MIERTCSRHLAATGGSVSPRLRPPLTSLARGLEQPRRSSRRHPPPRRRTDSAGQERSRQGPGRPASRKEPPVFQNPPEKRAEGTWGMAVNFRFLANPTPVRRPKTPRDFQAARAWCRRRGLRAAGKSFRRGKPESHFRPRAHGANLGFGAARPARDFECLPPWRKPAARCAGQTPWFTSDIRPEARHALPVPQGGHRGENAAKLCRRHLGAEGQTHP